MAKRTRAPARGGRTTQTTRRSRKPAKKTANKTAEKPKRKTTQKSEFAQTRHASLSRRWSYTPELLSYVRQRFEQSGDSLADIGLAVRISKETVRHLAFERRWKRYVRPPHGLPPALKPAAQVEAPVLQEMEPSTAQVDGMAILPQGEGEGDIPPLADTVARLHRAVLDELAAIDALPVHARNAASSVRTARTLASLTETLQKLQRMQPTPASNGPDDADMPADIDEFRNALARRIEEFVASRAHPEAIGGPADATMDAAVR